MRARSLTLVALAAFGLLIVLTGASASGGDHASAATGTATATEPVSASVKVIRCSRGPTAADRRATFRGAMSAIAGTDTMRLRFILQERADGHFRTVKAPGLSVWRKSRSGVAGFGYRQRVLELKPGYAYRMVVHYRWYDATGAIIASYKRKSSVCDQGRKLANLLIAEEILLAAGPSAGTTRYRVVVANQSKVEADGVEVALRVDGSEVDRRSVGKLAPGAVRQVWFVGPPCTARVEAIADPAGLLRESSEADNSRSLSCIPKP